MRFWILAMVVVLVAVGVALSPVNEYFFYASYIVLTFVVLATAWNILGVGSSRVDLQACKLEYSIVSPK